MIKLAKLTDYAVVVLAEMAANPGVLLSASSLADRTALPEPTVSKILKTLSSRKLITSTRGANGGYRLERKAASLPITEIIAAMEGPVSLTDCAEGRHEGCSLHGKCAVEGRWDLVNKTLITALGKVMLSDMIPARRA